MADVITPIAGTTDTLVTPARRVAAGWLLAGFAVLATVVGVAQFDPGRFVYVQPLRGAVVVSALICAVPAVVAGAVRLAMSGKQRARALKDCIVLVVLTAIAVVIAFLFVTVKVDYEMDHHAAVVATSPDGTYEVVTAMRHGDSGDYQILRARSRNGVFSRNAEYPLASICDELAAVRFAGPDELQIVTRSINEPREQTQGQVRIDPKTLLTTDQVSSCTGDQT
jgi:hypothetical protein